MPPRTPPARKQKSPRARKPAAGRPAPPASRASANGRSKAGVAKQAARAGAPKRASGRRLTYKPWGAANVFVRSSGLHGRGLFAARDLRKGERIVEYVGERLSKKESDRRTDQQWAKGRVYTFELNSRIDLDGLVPGNKARFANHSCDPNAESDNEDGKRIWIVALRDIKAGQEITYDYNFDAVDVDALHECHCGAANCRRFLVGEEHAAELQRKLAEAIENAQPIARPRRRTRWDELTA